MLPRGLRRWIRRQERKALSTLRTVRAKRQQFENREGFLNFNFVLAESRGRDGTSAMLRIKNEETKIDYCLQSIYDVFDEIVLVDNFSQDRTLELVRAFKQENDKEDKIKIYCYPFNVARCGSEHLQTAEDSVRSLVYYYNWALSRCSYRYVCKWDGDMVMRKETRESFKDFLQQIQTEKKLWVLYGQTIYRGLDGSYYRAEVNSEIMIYPYGFNPRFRKLDLYEAIVSEPPLPVGEFSEVSFYELKFTDEDEFSHWGTVDFLTTRKRRERKNFELVKMGDVSERFEKLPASFLEK